MEYNTQLNHLIMPEYGRHIQKMVEHACTIEDRDERNKLAQAIVNVMGTLNPHLRDIVDFKHKLWDHLFVISDFKLDVDSPFPKPSPENIEVKPQRIKYPGNSIKYKHYGRVMQNVIKEIAVLEEGETKDALVRDVANFMKMQYLHWNRDTVENELIFDQLKELSDNKIIIKDSIKLADTFEMRPKEEPLRKKKSMNMVMKNIRKNQNNGPKGGGGKKKRK
ncbi:MAG: DUF4290 domain-containing protein [Bacteroidia bacterium]